MTTHILSMTYGPKIEGVRNGTIRQTIRKYNPKRPFKLGDKLLIHGWSKKPYRSPWNWRIEARVILAAEIECWDDILVFSNDPLSQICPDKWGSRIIDELAKCDGIDPPNG